MKISRFLLPVLLAGVAAANVTHDGEVSSEDGTIYNIPAGGYQLVENENFYNCYSVGFGGAIYVGEGATVELKGSLEFAGNFGEAYEEYGEWFGLASSDVYLSKDATLILNAAAAGDVITLGSGVEGYDSERTAKIVKTGAGTANLGGVGDVNDFMCFEGILDVQQGKLSVRTDLNAVSATVSKEASLEVHGDFHLALLNEKNGTALSMGPKNANNDPDATGSIKGTEITLTSLKGGTLEDINFSVTGVDEYTVDDIVLINSNVHLNDAVATYELSNLVISADSSIVSSVTATLSGENYLFLGSASSDQLKGVTLADGVVLTLGCTPDILPSGEMGDTVVFDVILNGLQIAENANVTLAAGGVTTHSAELSITSWQVTEGGVSVSMSAKYVPEPATATLSLLALCGLAARRRRK